jgi:hypothetical protein
VIAQRIGDASRPQQWQLQFARSLEMGMILQEGWRTLLSSGVGLSSLMLPREQAVANLGLCTSRTAAHLRAGDSAADVHGSISGHAQATAVSV